MIRIQKVRVKNFMSYGDRWTEIDVMKTGSTLIIGKNGAGKSSIIVEALTYGLFGKAFRNINKPMLVNSVNNRDCLVEIEFTANSHSYKVVRGMKPGVFEIYMDGVLINQEAKSRDYQKVLEVQILKINYQSWKQIICLGSAAFSPFMQLPPGTRKVIIDDLLDMVIFGVMSDEVKFKAAHTRERLKAEKSNLRLLESKISSHVSFIESIERSKVEEREGIETEISLLKESFKRLEGSHSTLKTEIATLRQNLSAKREEASSLERSADSKKSGLRRDIADAKKKIQFYQHKKVCPTCEQEIDSSFSHSHVDELARKMEEDESNLLELESATERSLSPMRADIKTWESELREREQELSRLNSEGLSIQKQITYLQEKLLAAPKGALDVDSYRAELEKLKEERFETDKKIRKHETRLKYFEEVERLLSDQGIKAQIIKTYVPLINSLINKYLREMEFHVSFHLDENFNETIRSRYRDTFTYSSFSQGEKAKIDLALLFTWREISKLKNSTNVNLLVMDETMDGSLDEDAVRYFLKIIQSADRDTNVFVISHNDKVRDSFDRMLVATKEGNFSVLTEA